MQNLSTGSIQELLLSAFCEVLVFGCFLFRCKIYIKFYSKIAFVSRLRGFGFWLLSFPMQNLNKCSIQKLLLSAVCEVLVFGCFRFRCKV